MIRVVLPYHLRTLAKVQGEVELAVEGPPTLCAVLDTLEAIYPMLGGLIRIRGTLRRRPLVRFYVRGEDWSHEPLDAELPGELVSGREPLMIIGAMAGG